jgi:hypothetical protein
VVRRRRRCSLRCCCVVRHRQAGPRVGEQAHGSARDRLRAHELSDQPPQCGPRAGQDGSSEAVDQEHPGAGRARFRVGLDRPLGRRRTIDCYFLRLLPRGFGGVFAERHPGCRGRPCAPHEAQPAHRRGDRLAAHRARGLRGARRHWAGAGGSGQPAQRGAARFLPGGERGLLRSPEACRAGRCDDRRLGVRGAPPRAGSPSGSRCRSGSC